MTSPQAFQGLRDVGRKVRRPDLTFGTTDHNVPTVDIFNIRDLISKNQIDTLAKNVAEFGIDAATHGSERQGIVHMVGSEIGRSQPGKFIVCGDSHTATHGAFGAIAFGIGTSEVEHVFATQCIWQVKPKKMKVEFVGKPQRGVYSKDFILALIAQYGVDAGVGYAVERASIQLVSSHDVVALLHYVLQCLRHSGSARSHGKGCHTTLQGCDALLKHALGGVGQTAVDVACVAQGKAVGSMLGVAEHVRGGLIYRHCTRVSGRIGVFLSYMKLECLEMKFLVAHKLFSFLFAFCPCCPRHVAVLTSSVCRSGGSGRRC